MTDFYHDHMGCLVIEFEAMSIMNFCCREQNFALERNYSFNAVVRIDSEKGVNLTTGGGMYHT
jgi:hypothetical protein